MRSVLLFSPTLFIYRQFNGNLFVVAVLSLFLREKCKDTIVSLHDLIGLELEITPTGNKRYRGLANRTMGELRIVIKVDKLFTEKEDKEELLVITWRTRRQANGTIKVIEGH